jgi:hypothetical protein
VVFGGQQLHEVRMDEQLLTPGLHLSQDPNVHSSFKYTDAVCRFAIPASTTLPMRL